MRRFLLSLATVILAVCAAAAQERGTTGLGPRFGVYAHTGGEPVYGVGVEMRYNISDPVRVVPSVTWLFNRDCSAEIACDLHYMFRMAKRWQLYPLAGVSVNDIRGWSPGLNVGLGTDYAVARHIDISAGVRWLVECSRRQNPVVAWFGTTFKF